MKEKVIEVETHSKRSNQRANRQKKINPGDD